MKHHLFTAVRLLLIAAMLVSLVPAAGADAAPLHSIAAGIYHTAVIREDGSVMAVGFTDSGRCDVGGWSSCVAISAFNHTVGLRSDGTVMAVGMNRSGQCDVAGWQNIIAIDTSDRITVGLTGDGRVLTAGENDHGRCETGSWSGMVGIASGSTATYGLRSNGTVAAVGSNGAGQLDVGGWSDITQISAGNQFVVGLRSNGTVVAAGSNGYGQCNVSGWTDIVAVSAGCEHVLGLKADGTVVAAGRNSESQCNVSGWTDVAQISAGMNHSLAATRDGIVLAVGSNGYGMLNMAGGTVLHTGAQDYSGYLAPAKAAREAAAAVCGSDAEVNALAGGRLVDWDQDGTQELFLSYPTQRSSLPTPPEFVFSLYDEADTLDGVSYDAFLSSDGHGFADIISYEGNPLILTAAFIEQPTTMYGESYRTVRVSIQLLHPRSAEVIRTAVISCDGTALRFFLDNQEADAAQFRAFAETCQLTFDPAPPLVTLEPVQPLIPINQLMEQLG